MTTGLVQLAQEIIGPGGAEGACDLGLGGAVLLRRSAPSAIEGTLYRPLICLILQGAKDVVSGAVSVHCPAGHAIMVSHDLPVVSRITEAAPDAPYIAFVLPLDLGLLREFYGQISEMPETAESGTSGAALAACPADAVLSNAVERFLTLVREGRGGEVLGPILLCEIHARLLMSPQGAMLRRFLRRDDPSNQLARAIASIRASIADPLSIAALAAHAGMSKSSFHAHFKAVTGFTPGQYQKDIRLLEARRLVTESDAAISSVAYDVGYESPAQFSRDYARKYGRTPRDDRAGARRRTETALSDPVRPRLRHAAGAG